MPSDPPARCAACAARDRSLCAGLAAPDLRALHAIGRRRTLAAGQVVLWAGEVPSVCANLVSGVLKVSRMDEVGRTQIVGLLFPGDFVGDLFSGRSVDTIGVLATADLCVYPREGLERVLCDHPAARRLLLRRTMTTLVEARRTMPMLAHAGAGARVAAFLIDMARRSGGATDASFVLPLSRGAMAEALGLAIETVSRHLTAFRQSGLITTTGLREIRLLDHAGLAQMAG